MEELYETKDLQKIFKHRWSGPKILIHGIKTLIAKYKKLNEDGFKVEVYCDALPAEFFEVVALDDDNNVEFSFQTGSGVGKEVDIIAKLISDGMLTLGEKVCKKCKDSALVHYLIHIEGWKYCPHCGRKLR
jgi:hypothetical protein